MKDDGLFIDQLYLQNFATFESERIFFGKGMNVIVGETGSGKSLILDALSILFGGRAEKSMIRKSAEFSVLEVNFHVTDLSVCDYLTRIGHPVLDNQIIIKRIIHKKTGTKTFLNHQVCTSENLKKFSRRFVDLVGQFENQKLLSPNYLLNLVDKFSKNEISLKKYQHLFYELQEETKRFNSLNADYLNVETEKDFLLFQKKEIELVSPEIDEDILLAKKKEELLQQRSNTQSIEEAIDFLSGDNDYNILNQLNSLNSIFSKLDDLGSFKNKLIEIQAALEDLSYELAKNLRESDHDEQEYIHIIDRLDSIQKIKRKYGPKLCNVHEKLILIASRLKYLEDLEHSIKTSQKKILDLKKEAFEIAESLHHSRLLAAEKLSKLLTKAIQSLNMSGATLRFEILKKEELNISGFSELDFFAETNPGEGEFKVRKTASGGELSRILLALRQILSSKDSVSIFLFDEIDSGIGGKTAICIGSSLHTVSTHSQVLAITHLPQIIKFAGHIINVEKTSIGKKDNQRTISKIDIVKDKNQFINTITEH
ncbi:MAG: AAA family ATPase [Halobacteriovoraceae bacterium]|nr:AAA family ATPase [Halobacteriovoraceae bacterium]